MDLRLRTLLLPAILSFAAGHGHLTDVAQTLDGGLLRSWFSIRGPRSGAKDVTVVRMDRRSFKRLGIASGQSLSFKQFAAAIDKINAAKPKLIVLDVLFSQAAREPEDNADLCGAISRSPTVIASGVVSYIDTNPAGEQSLSWDHHVPVPEFAASAKQVVPLMVSRESDGSVTRISLARENDPMPLPQIPLLGPLRQFVKADIGQPGYHDLINYYGPPYFAPDVPVYKLLSPEENVPEEYFRGKVVLMGSVDIANTNPDGHDDSFSTPMSSAPMFGVEIHASIVQNLLDGGWIRRASRTAEGMVLGLVALAIGLAFVHLGLFRSFCVYLGVTALWAIGSYSAFAYGHFFIPGTLLFGVLLPLGLLVSAIHTWAKCHALAGQ
ncbi:CHASE2 domain-containing protein [bacterium]|nr:CHASE2 domain-containing protein [bacterium]